MRNLFYCVGVLFLPSLVAFGQEEPQDSPAFTRLGIMTIRSGKIEDGLKHLDKAINLDHENSLAWFWRGRTRASIGQFAEAVKDFDKVIKLDPEDPTAYVERAQAKIELKDEQGAKADMDMAIKLQPSLAEPPKEIKIAKAPEKPADPEKPTAPEKPAELPKKDNGSVVKIKGKELSLTDMMGKLIDIKPEQFTSEKYMTLGIAKMNTHNYPDAIWYFDRALTLDPQSARAYSGRGEAKMHARNYQESIKDLDQALQMNPKDVAAYIHRSESKYLLKDYRGAIADASKAIELNPKLAEAYLARAEPRRDMAGPGAKSIPEVDADLEMARKLLPKTAKGYFDLSKIHYRYAQFKEAIEAMNEAIKLDPQYGEAYGNRGYYKYLQGDYKGAIADYEKSLELRPYDKAKIQGLIDQARTKMR